MGVSLLLRSEMEKAASRVTRAAFSDSRVAAGWIGLGDGWSGGGPQVAESNGGELNENIFKNL
jgi:hypothetical protein